LYANLILRVSRSLARRHFILSRFAPHSANFL
jgi:hypothetical protein